MIFLQDKIYDILANDPGILAIVGEIDNSPSILKSDILPQDFILEDSAPCILIGKTAISSQNINSQLWRDTYEIKCFAYDEDIAQELSLLIANKLHNKTIRADDGYFPSFSTTPNLKQPTEDPSLFGRITQITSFKHIPYGA